MVVGGSPPVRVGRRQANEEYLIGALFCRSLILETTSKLNESAPINYR